MWKSTLSKVFDFRRDGGLRFVRLQALQWRFRSSPLRHGGPAAFFVDEVLQWLREWWLV